MFFLGVLVTALAAIIAVAGLHIYTNAVLFPKVAANQPNYKPFEKLIFADFHKLEQIPAFKKIEYTKNAADYLNQFISGSNRQNDIVERLFRNYPNWVYNKIHFNRLTADDNFVVLNPKWLEKIKMYDYWQNLSPIGSNENENGAKLSLLRNWAAVYAIKKLQTKDLNAGLKVYRKAAELINSVRSLESQLLASSMLTDEHKLMNDFQARDWHLIPIESIDAYRRLSRAWISLSRQAFFEEISPEVKKFTTPQFGACASANDNVPTFLDAKRLLEPQFWIEKNFQENYSRVHAFQESLLHNCFLTDAKQMIELSSNAGEQDMKSFSFPPKWERLPLLRRFVGLRLLMASNFDSFSDYRDLANEKVKH